LATENKLGSHKHCNWKWPGRLDLNRNGADLALITKSELAFTVEFDEAAVKRNIQAVWPGKEVFKVSVNTGEGMDEYFEFLESRRVRSRAVAAV